jgi:hypothetical protein
MSVSPPNIRRLTNKEELNRTPTELEFIFFIAAAHAYRHTSTTVFRRFRRHRMMSIPLQYVPELPLMMPRRLRR